MLPVIPALRSAAMRAIIAGVLAANTEALGARSLSPSQLLVFLFIYNHEHTTDLEIVRGTGLGTVKHPISALRDRHLIESRMVPVEKPFALYSLTPRGLNLIICLTKRYAEAYEKTAKRHTSTRTKP